jgi:hypothetical protein
MAFLYPDAPSRSTPSTAKLSSYKPMMSKILTPVTFAKVLLKNKQNELKNQRNMTKS